MQSAIKSSAAGGTFEPDDHTGEDTSGGYRAAETGKPFSAERGGKDAAEHRGQKPFPTLVDDDYTARTGMAGFSSEQPSPVPADENFIPRAAPAGPATQKAPPKLVDGDFIAKTPSAGHDSPQTPLEWLKIIESATADLKAGTLASKDETPARPRQSGTETPYPAPRQPEARRRSPDFDATDHHDDYGDERKLAQKLAYRFTEPRPAPQESLRSVLMPYIAATGVFAFLAGSAVVYFATGSSPADVKKPAAQTESQIEMWTGRPDQSSKKGSIQRAPEPSAPAVKAASTESNEIWGPKPEEQASKPEAPAAASEPPLQTWSDTVETFKQLVQSDQKPPVNGR